MRARVKTRTSKWNRRNAAEYAASARQVIEVCHDPVVGRLIPLYMEFDGR